MATPYILEITCDSLAKALAAQRGGAHRIELCSNLSQGGLTPGNELTRMVREQVQLPVFTMIRPRAGDFVYSEAEFAQMRREIVTAVELGMNGVVLGILTADGRVDIERTQELVELAHPLPVTFHRAFDASADADQSLEEVIQTGAARILTSGGASTAMEGRTQLAELVRRGRIIIVPGAGITAANADLLAKETGAAEFHAGLSSLFLGVQTEEQRFDDQSFEDEVRKLAKQLLPHPHRQDA